MYIERDMPKRKTFRKRHRKMNQKGGAGPSNYWLKVTRRNQNQNDIAVEIIDNGEKDQLCSTSSSASGGGPSFYNSFEEFVNDDAVDENKPLLLQLADNAKNFTNPFELSSLSTITTDHINWDVLVSC